MKFEAEVASVAWWRGQAASADTVRAGSAYPRIAAFRYLEAQPQLLAHVVEEALAGRSKRIKACIIAASVFDLGKIAARFASARPDKIRYLFRILCGSCGISYATVLRF